MPIFANDYIPETGLQKLVKAKADVHAMSTHKQDVEFAMRTQNVVGLGVTLGEVLTVTDSMTLSSPVVAPGPTLTVPATGTAALLGVANEFTGDLYFNAGQRIKRTTVANVAYTILTTDSLIAMTTLTAPRTLTLPTVASALVGRSYLIVDESGNAGTHAITIDGAGAELVNGAATYLLNKAYGSVALYCTGSAWIVPQGSP